MAKSTARQPMNATRAPMPQTKPSTIVSVEGQKAMVGGGSFDKTIPSKGMVKGAV